MKEVVKFGISIWMLYLNMDKPFNPILVNMIFIHKKGETYQGRINGTPIYCEQVSHHPPICSFFMPGRGYKFFFLFYYENIWTFRDTSINGC